MRERDIELYLTNKLQRIGGQCLKFVSPGHDGVPDRIILLPGGIIAFAELKASGQKPRPIQTHWLKTLEKFGFLTYVIDSKSRVDVVVNELKGYQADVREQLEE